MKISLIHLLFIGLCVGSCITPQNETANFDTTEWLEYTTPEEAGFDPDSLKNIDNVIERLTTEGKIPGAAALLARDGKIFYQTARGYRDIDSKTALDTTDIFRIASMTKPITSVAILQLYEKGKLDLFDPVHKFIPSFKNPQVLTSFNSSDTTWESKAASREITIHDLLTHTAGIKYGFTDAQFGAIYSKNNIPDLAVASQITIEEITERLGKMPLAHNPGEKFTYGLNTDVLGRIVEVASGMSLEDYVYKNITNPLMMNDTRYFYEPDVSERLTTVYVVVHKDSAITKMEPNNIYDPEYPVKGAKAHYSGGSGMSGTLQDYFIFSQTLLNGGEYNGVRILQDSTVKLMASNQLGENRWEDHRTFGYGLKIVREKDESGNIGDVIELGWSGAFNTYYFINPKEKLIGVLMSQVLMNPYGGELVGGFQRALESAREKEEAANFVN